MSWCKETLEDVRSLIQFICVVESKIAYPSSESIYIYIYIIAEVFQKLVFGQLKREWSTHGLFCCIWTASCLSTTFAISTSMPLGMCATEEIILILHSNCYNLIYILFLSSKLICHPIKSLSSWCQGWSWFWIKYLFLFYFIQCLITNYPTLSEIKLLDD